MAASEKGCTGRKLGAGGAVGGHRGGRGFSDWENPSELELFTK